MSIAQWRNKVSRFGELNGPDKWLLLRAVGWIAIARIMLAVMSFSKLSARLSVQTGPTCAEPDPEVLGRIGHAVSAAANNVPWRSDCLPQTIAARMLLKRVGYASTIHLGVDRVGEDQLAGHAWLTCGETVVIGDAELNRYTEIHSIPL